MSVFGAFEGLGCDSTILFRLACLNYLFINFKITVITNKRS